MNIHLISPIELYGSQSDNRSFTGELTSKFLTAHLKIVKSSKTPFVKLIDHNFVINARRFCHFSIMPVARSLKPTEKCCGAKPYSKFLENRDPRLSQFGISENLDVLKSIFPLVALSVVRASGLSRKRVSAIRLPSLRRDPRNILLRMFALPTLAARCACGMASAFEKRRIDQDRQLRAHGRRSH